MTDTINAECFDARQSVLGEGPLWHPLRQELFWFDIINKRMMSRRGEETSSWQFKEHVSAAGWVDEETLLIASETGLRTFSLSSRETHLITSLEAENPVTRSNDGRADPWGGFWIGTMGKSAETGAGKIYRYFKGALTVLFDGLTIPNAICFSPDRHTAYFTDTPRQQIMAQPLDAQGFPEGPAGLFVDLRAEGLFPDGAVVDREGCLWNAQWGAGRVARYAPDGRFLSQISLPAPHASCPAFGGAQMTELFVTTATENIAAPTAQDGQVFCCTLSHQGQAEPAVRLG